MNGWRYTCPRDTGDGKHISATFFLPEMPPAQVVLRWEGINAAFEQCACGAMTVMETLPAGDAPRKTPTLAEVNAAWVAAGRDVSARSEERSARAFYRGVLDQVKQQKAAPKGVYRKHTPAENTAIAITQRWLRATAPKRSSK